MKELIVNMFDGKIINKDDVRRAFGNLKDGKHLITIKDFRRRSIQQNAYYWSVIIPLVRSGLFESGFDDVRTDEDAHKILKHVFLKKQMINHLTGEMIEISGSTTTLSISEFNEFIESVIRWASEYINVVIPDPNEAIANMNEWTYKVLSQCD